MWEVVLEKLGAWDLKSLETLLPVVADDARNFINLSEGARGALRNGGMLLATLHIRNGQEKEGKYWLDEVVRLQASEELEGQFRTKLRCKLLRSRTKGTGRAPCVTTLALLEELYRYRLLRSSALDLAPIKADLEEISLLLDDLPDSWVPFELDLATHLWKGVLARIEGNLDAAVALFEAVLKLADENKDDLESIPCLYHLYIAWVELMCVRIEQNDWVAARHCRKACLSCMHEEVDRTSAQKKDNEKDDESWLGLGGFSSGLKKLLIPPTHPLHPNCPFFFWQILNVLEMAGKEINARLPSEEEETDEAEEWYSDQGEPNFLESPQEGEMFFSDDEGDEPDLGDAPVFQGKTDAEFSPAPSQETASEFRPPKRSEDVLKDLGESY